MAWVGGDVFVLKRIRSLIATTLKLRTGELSARTGQPHDGSEIGHLAASFDEMAEALQQKNEERDKAEAELARRNEELESFTYSVSHDLKEPLRTLKSYSQFLLQDYETLVDDEGRELLHGMGSASVRMARQIDELLTLSRLSREAPAARVDVNSIIQEVIEATGV